MKRLVIILLILIIFFTSLVLILNSRSQAPAGLPVDSANAKEIKPEIITRHNTATDCWVAIGGSVYRLDNYFSKQPDENLATQLCGKIEPDVKLPSNLKTEVLFSYRIGLLSL